MTSSTVERSYRRLDAEQALTFIFDAFEHDRPYTLFDTRDAENYGRGHLPSAQHLLERDIGQWIGRVPRSQPVLVYCYHGNASQTVAQTFADFGYAEVYSIDGGFHALAHAWQHAREAAARAKTAMQPNAELTAWLAAQGFAAGDVNAAVANGMTPLMRAARDGRADLVEQLLALGAAVDARNTDGNTALWLACYSGSLDCIARLLDAGAAIDNQNDNGASCLMYAASNGKHEVVKLLLERGANAQLGSLDGYRAVDLAATVECLRLLRHTA